MRIRNLVRTLSVALGLWLGDLTLAVETLVLEEPELAGISGFRAQWDKPVMLAADGATVEKNHGRFGGGPVANWGGTQPGAIAFDAVHRSLLVRFPDAAAAIADRLRDGAAIRRVELVLPFKNAEFFPLDYDMPAGLSFLGDTWVKTPPNWHAVAWALRKPWSADGELGPTFNAAVNGKVYWEKYGAQGEGDRFPTRFGPAELSAAVPVCRVDVTACLTKPTFGGTVAQRLRRFSDCGLLVRKWEVYDARYWTGGYEWGVGVGQRGIVVGGPRLEVTFSVGGAQGIELPPPAPTHTVSATGRATATVPDPASFARLASRFSLAKPAWAPDWQWQRLVELRELGGGQHQANGFPQTYEGYLDWLDQMLSLYPRAWKGFSAGDMAVDYAMHHEAIPEAVKDNLRRYWWAWLMPDRPYSSLVHGYVGGRQAADYYKKTQDWRGNFSVYRTYLHSMGTVNFNSWATTGAMFGGWIIGDEGIMREAREGYDHWMTRTWTWQDGSSQESIDHYYLAHTLGPLKAIADFAPGQEERLAGRLNTEKHVDELIACWHPNLRRFISSSGRTGIAYPLYLQEGLNYIIHTLSRRGALTDIDAKSVAGRKGGAFAHEFSPAQVALQTQVSPWASPAAAALVDHKPLPYEATRAYVQWGSYKATPLWKKSYLGQHYGLASQDIVQNETIPVMAQWRRKESVVQSHRELGTLLVRYGINDTEFLDSLYHGTRRRNPNGSVGVQGGPTATVQGANSAIVFGSPTPDLKLGKHSRPVPVEIRSLQLSLAMLNFEAKPSWSLYVDGVRIESLPVALHAGQRITIHDGVSYIGIIPLPALELGAREQEVLISAKGKATEMQGGGQVKVALTIDVFNYRSDIPIQFEDAEDTVADGLALAPVSRKAMDRAVACMVVQMGDQAEHGTFAAFQTWFEQQPYTSRWDADAGVYHVAYGEGKAKLEAGFNPTAPLAQPTTQVLPYRRFAGVWPYLQPGVYRDTTTAVQGTTGRLEKNGATLKTRQGAMACLQAFPEQQVYVAINPYREYIPVRLELPGDVVLSADGLVGQLRIEANLAAMEIDVHCARAPVSDDPTRARVLIIEGISDAWQIAVDGASVTPHKFAGGLAVPIVQASAEVLAPERIEERLQRLAKKR